MYLNRRRDNSTALSPVCTGHCLHYTVGCQVHHLCMCIHVQIGRIYWTTHGTTRLRSTRPDQCVVARRACFFHQYIIILYYIILYYIILYYIILYYIILYYIILYYIILY
jgi:hypothetical protein